MKDHDGDYRAFIWESQAYYFDALPHNDYVDSVTLGLFSPEGGASGEMHVRWVELGKASVPQLRVFDDAWSALATFTDVIEAMGSVDDENITPQEFVEILKGCDFVDITKRESPYKEDKVLCPTCGRELEV